MPGAKYAVKLFDQLLLFGRPIGVRYATPVGQPAPVKPKRSSSAHDQQDRLERPRQSRRSRSRSRSPPRRWHNEVRYRDDRRRHRSPSWDDSRRGSYSSSRYASNYTREHPYTPDYDTYSSSRYSSTYHREEQPYTPDYDAYSRRLGRDEYRQHDNRSSASYDYSSRSYTPVREPVLSLAQRARSWARGDRR